MSTSTDGGAHLERAPRPKQHRASSVANHSLRPGRHGDRPPFDNAQRDRHRRLQLDQWRRDLERGHEPSPRFRHHTEGWWGCALARPALGGRSTAPAPSTSSGRTPGSGKPGGGPTTLSLVTRSTALGLSWSAVSRVPIDCDQQWGGSFSSLVWRSTRHVRAAAPQLGLIYYSYPCVGPAAAVWRAGCGLHLLGPNGGTKFGARLPPVTGPFNVGWVAQHEPGTHGRATYISTSYGSDKPGARRVY